MLRQIKPKNARSKRVQDDKSPKLVENAKTAIFVQTSTCNELTRSILLDLATLKKPDSLSFNRRKDNQVLPFEDASSIEFFAEKNDASIVVLGSHSKKRPHNIVFARTFDYKLLDMLEVGVEGEKVKLLRDFPMVKSNVGVRPLMCFCGPLFESHEPFRQLKSFMLDLYRGREIKTIDAVALQHVLVFSHGESAGDSSMTPAVHMRGYLIRAHRTGNGKLPRVELDEMGPSIDLRVRRGQPAEEGLWKDAMRRPTKQQPKTKKNVDTDAVGDKVATVHVGRQDLAGLQTRKFKGLKRGRSDADDDEDDVVDDDEGSLAGGQYSSGEDEDDDDDDDEEDSPPAKRRA
ncbi:rRNA-binding ribosome biosynthesis protein rpf2 [Savitreella phatthalungensis]